MNKTRKDFKESNIQSTKLDVTQKGVLINGVEINGCTAVDIEKITPVGAAEVTLHLLVDQLHVDFAHYGVRQTSQEV